MISMMRVLRQTLQGLGPAPAAAIAVEPAEYSLAELKKHNTEDDCWIAVEGGVYDVTGFLDEHPGGGSMLMSVAGTDATGTFKSIHKDYVLKLFGKEYLIGKLVLTAADLVEAAVELPEDAFQADSGDLQPSEFPAWNSGGTAGTLPAERDRATFEVEVMTNLLDGGVEETERRRSANAPQTPCSVLPSCMRRGLILSSSPRLASLNEPSNTDIVVVHWIIQLHRRRRGRR